ncbi:Hypothetical protein FKW44_014769 [Caligus rogercresseyi]|uniref:Uncharacterized protein n=1 Tax=Caligus rogercresseyi TaxID=217165 RepID=A0A7T8GZE1_CALRO|nr:Hypothetical protein FKW44_014769 [Caligus rogercresseyi]
MEKFRSAKMIREVLNLVLRWEEASSSAGYFKGMFEPEKRRQNGDTMWTKKGSETQAFSRV